MAAALVVFKWPYLSLPAYWDEGFPYAYGIRYLHDHELTLMPAGMPELYSTGHPTLFYFLAAGWMRIFGTEIGIAHIFPLLVSVILLWAVFRLGKTFVSPWAGTGAALLLATRTIFITQSSFLLPETLLALFCVLALHSWLAGNKTGYIIWTSLLLLTKEPGIVFAAVIGLLELVHLIRNVKSGWKYILIRLLTVASPLVPFIGFFIVQKIQMGWYFFPRHMNSFQTTAGTYFDKLIGCFGSHFFIYYGGIAVTAVVFLSAILIYRRHRQLNPVQRKLAAASFLFTIAFICFSSFSFPIPRYMLCLYGPFFVMTLLLIRQVFAGSKKKFAFVIVIVLAGIQLGYAWDIRGMADFDLGYADVVKTQQEAVRWCIDQGYREKKIFTTQQLQRGMESDAAGFVGPGENFTQVSFGFDAGTDLFIFTCTENSEKEIEARKIPMKSLARFESGKAWTEIFAPEKNSP